MLMMLMMFAGTRLTSGSGLHRQEALPYYFDHLQSSHLAAKLSTKSRRALLSNQRPISGIIDKIDSELELQPHISLEDRRR